MSEAIFHLIVIMVAAYALIRGFRQRFTGQLASLLGIAFGAVSARVFMIPVMAWLMEQFPGFRAQVGAPFIYSVFAVSIVYVASYLLFSLLSKILRSAMSVLNTGILDCIFGSFLSMTKYLLALSIAYNLMVCFNTSLPLVKYAEDSDGNVVEGVMLICPAFLGSYSVDYLAHLLQLQEAKKISYNLLPSQNVITPEQVT